MKRILLHKEDQILSILLDAGNKAADIGCYDENTIGIGNILICRVRDVAQNIQAAFVDIGTGVNAYLPITDLGEHTVFTKKNGRKQIVPGDELLVQISREPIKTKPASVTTKLSISGKYVAVTADGKGAVNFSKKISDAEFRRQTNTLLSEVLDKRFSMVLRTNAADADEKTILNEACMLQEKLEKIIQKAPYQVCLSHLQDALPDWLTDLRDTRDDALREVITDDEALYSQILAVQDNVIGAETALRLYDDQQLPLIKAYSIEKILREALSERVWMKSGGYLVIQPTEALVVIDVNSGKSEYKGGNKQAALKLNLEAAREAARQIRLRNLSGIILIDFINLDDDGMKQELLRELASYLREDRVHTMLMGMTRLELTEITRKKVHKPLYQTGVRVFVQDS